LKFQLMGINYLEILQGYQLISYTKFTTCLPIFRVNRFYTKTFKNTQEQQYRS